jgi:hypothetical protein
VKYSIRPSPLQQELSRQMLCDHAFAAKDRTDMGLAVQKGLETSRNGEYVDNDCGLRIEDDRLSRGRRRTGTIYDMYRYNWHATWQSKVPAEVVIGSDRSVPRIIGVVFTTPLSLIGDTGDMHIPHVCTESK